jgi:hypothetical protein
MRQKTAAITQSQTDGLLTTAFSPEDLLVFTLALANAWMPTSPMATNDQAAEQTRQHRDAVVEAVRRLVAGTSATQPLQELGTAVSTT